MYFLIDFENVHSQGLRGSEFLLSSDHVILYYSDSAPHIEHRHWENICKSGCGFEVCTLFKQRKNGLDFYIATKVGELFGAGLTNRAVIVSGDTGFQALRDYWQERSGTPHRIALGESIEHGIVSINENSARAAKIRSNQKMDHITNVYTIWKAERERHEALCALFRNTAYQPRLSEIESLLNAGLPPAKFYQQTLHCFGRVSGLEIYRLLKTLQ